MRQGDLLDLEWSDVDLAAADIHVRGTKSRAADRRIPIGAEVVDILKRRRAEQGLKSALVFPAPGLDAPTKANPTITWAPMRDGKSDASNFTSAMRDIFDAAELPWARTHTRSGTPTPQASTGRV